MLLICPAEGMHHRYTNLAQEDSGLTALGWQQTDALAGWLKTHYKVDGLVSGAQLRSRLTAQRVGQALGLPVTIQQGLPAAPIAPSADPSGLAPVSTPVSPADPLAISHEHSGHGREDLPLPQSPFCQALQRLLSQLRDSYAGKTVAVFMDASAVSLSLACIFDAHNLLVDVDHTGVSELLLIGGHWHVGTINNRQHLPMPELAAAEQPVPITGDLEDPEDLSLVVSVYNANVATSIDLEDDARRNRMRDLIRFANPQEGMKILDLGAGTGLLAMLLAESVQAELVGIDISPAMLERAEYIRLNSRPEVSRRVDFRLAAAQQLPFRNERFDMVISRLMLHLSHKPQRILTEAMRVLKPGGMLVVGDLLSVDDPVKRATQNAIEERRNMAHMAAHSSQQYRDLVTRAGFQVEQEEVVIFPRDLDDWLAEFAGDSASSAVVREMIEASLETDAAGINARRQGDQILFDQRLFYVRARKPHTAS